MSTQSMDLEKATESTFAKFSARLLTPSLLVLLGYLGNRQLSGMEALQAEQGKELKEMKQANANIATDVRVLSARIDYSVVSQVEQLNRRVEQLERARKSP